MNRVLRWGRHLGIGRAIGLCLIAALTFLRILDPPGLQDLRLRTFDFYEIVKPRESQERPVVIVDIDEASLKYFGQWPWPRTVVADLVSTLTRLGAAAIGFDIFFPEPDRLSPDIAADGFRNLDAETHAHLKTMPGNDQYFANAIAKSRVVLSRTALIEVSDEEDDENVIQTGFAVKGTDPTPFLVTYPHLLHNIAILEEAAAGHGLVTLRPERDGIVRRVPMIMSVQGNIAPSLTIEMLRVVTGGQSILVKVEPGGITSLGLRGFELPTDGNGQIWTYFAHHDKTKFVSARDVLEGKVTNERIGRKLVLIGTSALGLLDNKTTPVEASMPGVEVHAQIIENVLGRSMLSYPYYAPLLEIAGSILVSLALIALAPILPAFTLFLAGALVASIVALISWYSYLHYHVLLDATYPLLSTFAVFGTLMATNYVNEQMGRRQIRSAFGRYISPDLVEQLAQSPGKLVLGGEERVMTIMFSDVRGFTAIAETYKHDPRGLTSLMNRFLTPLTNAILSNKGTIDKYMGDAIMAFWNAPLDDSQHQQSACRSALDMLFEVEMLNAKREEESRSLERPFIPINIGIGLNTGACVVGNMGSDLRFDYSVLGDSVNLASRLESQSKAYGVKVIMGSSTASAVEDFFPILEIDRIRVAGKSEPETIFTIIGREMIKDDPRYLTLQRAHTKLLAAYRGQDWQEALTEVEHCHRLAEAFGLASLYDFYAERIAELRDAQLPNDWDGVWDAKSK
jgi:adenylate cyclase